MKILDTDLLVAFLRGKPNGVQAMERLLSERATTTLNAAELVEGAFLSQRTDEELRAVEALLAGMPVVPFGPRAARAYGPVRRDRKRRGAPGGLMDQLLASIAISEGAALVTRNAKDFEGIPELVVESW